MVVEQQQENELALVLARNLRRMRSERGWSQEELATRCKWPQPRISELEAGRQDRRLGTVHRLAEVFGTTPESMLREADAEELERIAAEEETAA